MNYSAQSFRLWIRLLLLVLFSAKLQAAVLVEPYTWNSVRIGAGGFVTGMNIHPLNANIRYARTDVGNAYRWDASTQNWLPIIVRNVEDGTGLAADIAGVPSAHGVESLAADPSNTEIVYMAFPLSRSNDVSSTYPASNGALYKSTNRGVTFARTGLSVPMSPNGDSRSYGERIGVDPRNSSVVYYGSVSSGLWRSINGGTDFTPVAAGGPPSSSNVLSIHFDPVAATIVENGQTRSSVLYATVFHGEVYRSTDGGESWSAISTSIDLSGDSGFSTIDRDGRLYVIRRPRGSYVDGNGQTQYYHYDSNEFWRYTPGTTPSWTKLLVLDPNGYGLGGPGNLASLAIDPNNPQRMFCLSGGGALNRSTNGGITWVPLADGYRYENTLAWLPQITANPYRANGGIYFDRDGRLWSPQGNEGVLTWKPSTNDSEGRDSNPRWTIQSEGIEEFVAHDVIIPPGSGDKAVVTVHDATVFFIDDPDQFTAKQATLQDQLISNGIGIAYCPNAPEYIAVSASDINNTSSGANYSGYSSDGGRTWTPFASRPANLQCGQIAVSRRGAWGLGDDHLVILPATNRPPSYSKDGGRTWLPSAGFPVGADGSPSDFGMFTFSLRQRLLVADPFVPDKYYLSFTYGPIYVSTDGGANWTSVGGNGLPIGRFHSQILMNRTLANDIWFADGWEGAFGGSTPHGLYRSTNGGADFVRNPTVEHALTFTLGAGRGLPGDAAYTVYVYGKITSDAVWGVFRSTDGAQTWTRVAYNPAGIFDRPSMMAASWDTFGLIYIAYNGESFVYGRPGGASPLTFTSQPQNVNSAIGLTVEFSAAITGSPRGSYLWQRRNPGSTVWVDIAGATRPRYSLTTASQDNGAAFRVRAFNASESITSQSATLTLLPLTAVASGTPLTGTSPLTVQFSGAAAGGRLGMPFDTTDDGLGTITARGDNAPGESAQRAFDNNLSTKWLDFAPDATTQASWLEYAYPAGTRRNVQSYALTSANDSRERDPYTWALLGSDNGTDWTVLDTRNAEIFANRGEHKKYQIATPGSYNRYRLRIDRVATPANANSVQLAELELIQEPAYTYNWTFGDGATSALKNPVHTYANLGNYTATLTVTDAETSAAASVNVSVLSAFNFWRNTKFTPAELNDIAISGPTGDPDDDGLKNLLEYALNREPLSTDSANTVTAALNESHLLTLTFLRARPEIIYTVEGSSDLISWTTVASDSGTVSLTQPVSVSDTAASIDKRFLRLRVTLP